MTGVFFLAAVGGLVLATSLVTPPLLHGQATISTGTIEGTILDPQEKVVTTATVTIKSKATGTEFSPKVTSAGVYNSGPLEPGEYIVRVEATGFKTVEISLAVRVGNITPGSVTLELGSQNTTVSVEASAVTINTEQAAVQGVLTEQQIENLPVNGRNFLDLAQLEPGVQIQDGTVFDPTKGGFSSISFGGRFGRTARIEVDGVDVSDETVGTTTTDIPASSIKEFQLTQSSLDVSNELTSSGAVNIVTKAGTNSYHGEAYGLFRDSSMAAKFPGGGSFQRNQEGGDVGGPVLRDKLFFFADGERTLQHAEAGVTPASPFDSFAGTFASPFTEGNLLGRLDWVATKSLRLFYRFSYFTNSLIAPSISGLPSYSFFTNSDITRDNAVGVDWSSGTWTHSIRFSYLRFQNRIIDAVRGSNTPFSQFPVALYFPSSGLATGPSLDAPQATPQSDHQIKYDVGKTLGAHTFRFGADYNRIQGGGFASFYGVAPFVINAQISPTPTSPYNSYDPSAGLTCPGGQTGTSCPLNYLPDQVSIGNGQGYPSEKPAFGLPFGGIGPDNRLGFYAADSWKIRPNLTFSYGLRYDRDTGRTDSDLPADAALNALLPGLGNRVRQPNLNFAPQAGIAWDPWRSGKTVFRAGAGIYYENAIFNNVLFDRPPRLETGTFFFAASLACNFGAAAPVPFGDGTAPTIPGGNATCSTALGLPVPAFAGQSTSVCPVGTTVAQCIANFQAAYQASFAKNQLGPNPDFIDTLIANGLPLSAADIFAPGYQTPRSFQMNIGVEHEFGKGLKLSADYVRNVGTHFLLAIDANHTGDAAYLNVPAAQAAIATTLGFCGVTTINAAITRCPTDPLGPSDPNFSTYVPRPALITDFAANGLDSPADLSTGVCNGPYGIGAACAFAGINPNIGPTRFLYPIGRSLYNGFDVKLTQNVRHPFRGVRYLNMQVSYTLSRFDYDGSANGLSNPGTSANEDQDFIDNALDFRDPARYFGPSLLDRTHQLNFGGYVDLPEGLRLGFVGHFWSPLADTPILDVPSGPGAIFQANFTGDGTINPVLPIAQTDASCGTAGGNCNFTTYDSGAYGRTLSPTGLANAIANYNSTIAGKTITPAGQALVNAGLMTEAQLIALGATPPSIPVPPAGQVGLGWLKAMDAQLSWVKHFQVGDHDLTVQPSVGFFNVFNFANFDGVSNTLSGSLSGLPGSINGTTQGLRSNQTGAGTGVFALGAPRVVEWGLKFTF
jgi:hypothetical protein